MAISGKTGNKSVICTFSNMVVNVIYLSKPSAMSRM